MNEHLSASNTDIEKKCPRCGDLFYRPKTLIEDERQRALEWEDCYRTAKVRIDQLQEQNEEFKIKFNVVKNDYRFMINLLERMKFRRPMFE